MHTKSKYNKYKNKIIYEILDIYEVVYKYNDKDLIECMNILRHKSLNEVKYIYTRLYQVNGYKLNPKNNYIL